MADGHFPIRERLPDLGAYPLPVGTYGVSFSVHQRGDRRWQVSQHAHCIDRAGEKDTFTDWLSDWPTKAEAEAALGLLPGRGA